MSSPFIKQTLVAGTLVILLGLPGMVQGRKAPAAPGNPKAAKQGNIDIPPALMPAVKRAMKARKQLLQAKMAVLKAAQHLQSEVKKLEASSKPSSGKGRVGKAPSMNPKNRNSLLDRNESLARSAQTKVSGNNLLQRPWDSDFMLLGLLLSDVGQVTKGTVSKTGTISNAKNTLVGAPGASTASHAALAPSKGKLNEVLSGDIDAMIGQVKNEINQGALRIQGNKLHFGQAGAAGYGLGIND